MKHKAVVVERSRASIVAAQEAAVRLVEDHGFQPLGETLQRVAHTVGGKAVILPPRRRWGHPEGLRVTIGRDTTYFYRLEADEPISVAVLKTYDTATVRATLKRLHIEDMI